MSQISNFLSHSDNFCTLPCKRSTGLGLSRNNTSSQDVNMSISSRGLYQRKLLKG